MTAASTTAGDATPTLLSRSASSQRQASTAGWCRRRRLRSICASAWPMASRSSGSRCRARSSALTASRFPNARPAPRRLARKAAGTLKALTATDCNWSQFDLGWMFTFFFVLLGVSAAIWGGWLERAGPRKAGVVATICWCGGLADLGVRRLHPSAVADVAWRRRHRRRRSRPWLHLARFDADQMVPGPARHGDRHGHHGLRRRRHDRLAAGDTSDGQIQDGDRSGRLADVRRHGGDLCSSSC